MILGSLKTPEGFFFQFLELKENENTIFPNLQDTKEAALRGRLQPLDPSQIFWDSSN